jgi:heptosyltransferase III
MGAFVFMKTAAVIPSRGIGDALLMMISSHQLHLAGYEVTTFHPSLSELQNWFCGHRFGQNYLLEDLSSYSLVIFENDNSEKAQLLKKLRQEGTLPNLSLFYPSYLPSKHGPLFPFDRAFDETKPMAQNVSQAIASLLNTPASKDNGIRPPLSLKHRHYSNRIVIHPTSSMPQKNWTLSKYIELAKRLKKQGYEVVFSLSPKEREEMLFLEKEGINLPLFANLSELAAFLYESAFLIGNDSLTGHLASNLEIPTVIIADKKERMQLWRPDWKKGIVITPPSFLPKWKLFRQNWQNWISIHEVIAAFNKEKQH